MNISCELEMTIAIGNILGEGVSWRPTDQTLWWTDIEGKTLYKLPWGQTNPQEYKLPLRLGSFGFVDGSEDVLIAAFENGFAYFWPANGDIKWLSQPPELELGCGRRLNDGRVGPDGAFWVGSMLEQNDVAGGQGQTGLYRLNQGGEAKFIHGGLHISNGICWSPDEQKIFLADSPKNLIRQASFDATTGQCGSFDTFTQTKDGVPDGAIIDSEGRYWSALWGGHCVAVYDNKGNEVFKLNLPVPQPTIPVFAGPNLNYIVITSATQDLSSQQKADFPQSGNVLIYKTDVRGLNPYYYCKP